MRRLLLALPLLLAALPAGAQVREFSCVGAERFTDEVVIVTFARNSSRLGSDAAGALQPLAEVARGALERNFCVLGYASAGEGGAQTAARLAARRARAVGLELAKMGIERDRVRAEARTRGFAHGGPAGSQGVDRRPGARVVLLPSP